MTGLFFGCDADDEGEIVTVTNRGFIKRTLAADYQPQGRGGVGSRTIRFTRNKSNGSCLAASFYGKILTKLYCSRRMGQQPRSKLNQYQLMNGMEKGTGCIGAYG